MRREEKASMGDTINLIAADLSNEGIGVGVGLHEPIHRPPNTIESISILATLGVGILVL